MRLTLHADYGLRVLTYISLKSGQRCTIREIAEAYDISRNHLMKVVHQMQKLGYLDTVRGKGGGLALALPAEQIRLGELVSDLEPDLYIAECFGPENNCIITPDCKLRGMLKTALDAFIDSLNQHTLAELARPGPRSQALRATLRIATL